ncbi:MAG: chemotaxis protein CheW [Spirochaetaceae bacterium]
MSDYLDPNNEELLKDFFVEAELQVETLESNVLVLENDPNNQDAVDEIFRAAHTLKGGSATVQMNELSHFTHLVEDVLDEIRKGVVAVSGDVVDILLQSIDVVKDMLDARKSGASYDGDTEDIEAALKRILKAESSGGEKDASGTSGAEKAGGEEKQTRGKATALSEYEILELRESVGAEEELYEVVVYFDESGPMNTVGGIQLFAALKGEARVLKTEPDFDQLYSDTYFPVVRYYVASERHPGEYEDKLNISEVTTGVEIRPVEGESGSVRTKEARSEPQESAEAEEEAASERAEVSATEEAEEPEQKSGRKPGGEEPKKQRALGSVLRVDSSRIDNLLNLVSETVINKASFNQITNEFSELLSSVQSTEARYRELLKDLFDALPDYLEQMQQGKTAKEVRRELSERFSDLPGVFEDVESSLKGTVNKFRGTAQNLGRITGELQEGVMRIRMVPISQIFSRFPRLVRDLSKSLKKQVVLDIEGEDTELDKSVIEDLLDPLIHMVRNSIDHGVEEPEERVKAGKAEEGTVQLKASNEGNMILIEIIDDGKGIDVDSVRRKAIERGVIHPNKQLSDVEAFNLIFEPGFSTAKQVTDVSGRGVGLDVVKKQIEKLNGNVSVWSEQDRGSRFTIKIPLTLAIIQGLLVRVGEEMYAIPITSVVESHRIRPSDIKMIDNYEVFNVRDDVVSLIRLNRLFRVPTDENKEYFFVVIVGSGDKKMGLIVDSLVGEEDVVIKPLRDHFTNAPGIAGANITGDGRVSLIIDVSQLLDLGLRREREERKKRELTIG